MRCRGFRGPAGCRRLRTVLRWALSKTAPKSEKARSTCMAPTQRWSSGSLDVNGYRCQLCQLPTVGREVAPSPYSPNPGRGSLQPRGRLQQPQGVLQ